MAGLDRRAFLELLAPGDAEFLLERERWFDYRAGAELQDYRLELEAAWLPAGAGPGALGATAGEELHAVLRQSYRIGPGREERRVAFVDRYRREAGGWLHAGLASAEIPTAHFLVLYALPPEALGEGAAERELRLARASRVAAQAERAYAIVTASYGEAPEGRTTLKLYPDRELLRQDSKITIARPFNGWAEPGESIKLWLNPDPARDFAAIVAHELVHKTTLTQARNQCSWFAEGLANSLGSFEAMGGNYLDGGFHKREDYARSLSWLEGIDPESVPDDATWWLYGGMAGALVDFIREEWGNEAPRRLVEALAARRRPEAAYVYALVDAAYREDLRAALAEVLGLDWAGLEERWLAWLGRR